MNITNIQEILSYVYALDTMLIETYHASCSKHAIHNMIGYIVEAILFTVKNVQLIH